MTLRELIYKTIEECEANESIARRIEYTLLREFEEIDKDWDIDTYDKDRDLFKFDLDNMTTDEQMDLYENMVYFMNDWVDNELNEFVLLESFDEYAAYVAYVLGRFAYNLENYEFVYENKQ